MPSGFFFMLGLVVGTAIANKTILETDLITSITNTTSTFITNTTTFITNTSTMNTTINYDQTTIKTSNSSTEMNVSTESSGNSAISVATTGRAKPSSQTVTETKRTTKPQTTPAPGGPVASQTTKGTFPKSSTSSPKTAGSDKTGIIILVIIILVVVAFLLVCYVAKKRRRRYSVDFSSRQDEVNIPLSTVAPVDTAPQNGLKTFESTETTAKEPEELEAKPGGADEVKPEAQEEQKAETDKSVADPSTESATPAPAPAPDSSEDKPKADVAEPPAPVESTVEVKTDDEAAVSNKTSVESLKETNENNSNNAGFIQTRNLIFWEVPLDCPVGDIVAAW
ncbi:uncharacterized protein si:dkey-27h10.2 [Maylandia zebra]|uniref:uncharacterized protein si:dkey-27h10.2 n=1 Tax=Maylandia zebra TaxID=106582 RepID=UPI00403C58DA